MTLPYVFWPRQTLKPARMAFLQAPFTRGGAPSIDGVSRPVRSDRGFWRFRYFGVALNSAERRKAWTKLRARLSGRAGLIVLPIWTFDRAPWPNGGPEAPLITIHTDGTRFTDGTGYRERVIDIRAGAAVPIGSTVVTLRVIAGADDVEGIGFSYHHAYYETGEILDRIDENTFRVTVYPAIREAIGKGAYLECDLPTCMVHLEADEGMGFELGSEEIDHLDVSFIEATDWWNDLARNPSPVISIPLPEGEPEYLGWDNEDGDEELLIWDDGSGDTELLTAGF